MTAIKTLLIAAAVAAVSGQDAVLPTDIGSFYVGHPAFIQIYATEDESVNAADRNTVYISNFNALTLLQADYIYELQGRGRALDTVDSWVPTEIDRENYWPNDPIYMSSSVVGREGIVWTSGFLVPTKTAGALNIYFTDVDPLEGPYNIASLDEEDYSYHRLVWKDINNDGLLDAITCRFHTSLLGAVTKETLWLENPGNDQYAGWTQHSVLEDGADIFFQVAQIEADGVTYDVQINAEFWNERLTLYYGENNVNFWENPDELQQVVIDDTLGQPFDVKWDDYNLDGTYEILATAYDGSVGYVYIYLVPDDFRTGTFERITIADGFEANFILGGESMTPGAATLFYRSTEHETSGEKPYILLSGDDDGKHYILSPDSQDQSDWTYTKNQLVDTDGTTSGQPAAADLDGDGYTEILAPGYSTGWVHVFTYAPQ